VFYSKIFTLFVLTVGFSSYSQNKTIDSLRQQINNNTKDTNLCFAYELIGEQFYLNEPDSAIFYWQKAQKVSEQCLPKYSSNKPEFYYFKKNMANMLNNIGLLLQQKNKDAEAMNNYLRSLEIAKEINHKEYISISYNNIGYIHQEKGNSTKALEFYFKALEIEKEINDFNGIAISYNNIGLIYSDQGDVVKALEYYFKGLELKEKRNDKHGMIAVLNNIAMVYEDHGDLENALVFFRRALKLAEEIGDKRNIAHIQNNIAAALEKNNNYESSIKAYFKSLEAMESIEDKKGVALVYGNVGLIYKKMGQTQKALEYYQKCLKVRDEIGDKKGASTTLFNIGRLHFDSKKYILAAEFGNNAMKIAKELGHPRSIKNSAELLYSVYKVTGKHELALNNYELYVRMNDSINSESNRKASIRSQLKYEYEKQAAADSVAHAKESEIKNAELAKQKAEIKMKKNQQYALFGGLVLVCVFGAFMYNRFKITQKQKSIIEKQKDLVEGQKRIVEEKQKEILDSIHYAQRIQRAQLPNENFIRKNLDRLNKV